MLFDYLRFLYVEDDELSVLCKRKNERCCDDELQNWLSVTLVASMLVHLVPGHDLVRLAKGRVD